MSRVLCAAVVMVIASLGAVSVGAQGEGPYRAGLVVQYGDGSVATACVRFSEPELTGIELLERAGLPVTTATDGVGGAVCKIGPDGCDYPAEGCFCEREGARSVYWAFYILDGDAWGYANVGAGSLRAHDGDVHGWAWGLGESGSGAAPPVIDLETICGPAAAPGASATALAPQTPAASPQAAPTAAAQPSLASAEAPASPAPAPTGGSAPTPTPVPAGQGDIWGYLGFGALVLILGAGAALLARRR